MTPTRATIGMFRLEWTAETFRATMRGSPWGDALLLGGGLGGGLLLGPLFGMALGWKDGWKGALFVLPFALLLGRAGYMNGVARKAFAIEAFLTGNRSVWIRGEGDPVMIPAAEIVEFVPVSVQGKGATFTGAKLRTREGSRDLLPGVGSIPMPYCDALCGVLSALVLGQGTTSEALALAKGVWKQDFWAIVFLSLFVAGCAIFLVIYFVKD